MNPIAVQQLDTYYVDGFLHLMLYITVISLIMNMESNQVTDEKISFSMVAASVAGMCLALLRWRGICDEHRTALFFRNKINSRFLKLVRPI